MSSFASGVPNQAMPSWRGRGRAASCSASDGTGGRSDLSAVSHGIAADPIDAMLSKHRDMQAAKAFFRSVWTTMGFGPDRVTTNGHGSYPRAIGTVLGKSL